VGSRPGLDQTDVAHELPAPAEHALADQVEDCGIAVEPRRQRLRAGDVGVDGGVGRGGDVRTVRTVGGAWGEDTGSPRPRSQNGRAIMKLKIRSSS
jgi:hypothetical protein